MKHALLLNLFSWQGQNIHRWSYTFTIDWRAVTFVDISRLEHNFSVTQLYTNSTFFTWWQLLRIMSSSNNFCQIQRYLTNIWHIWHIWQIWWYLITNSELFAEEIHLFAIKYLPFCLIPGSFVKYVKYLSNISVFDRNYLMKKWS